MISCDLRAWSLTLAFMSDHRLEYETDNVNIASCLLPTNYDQ